MSQNSTRKQRDALSVRKKRIICKEHLEQTTTFSSVKTKKTFFIRDHLICSSSNIIYLTDCAKCGSVQYVGGTGNSLQNQFYQHSSMRERMNQVILITHVLRTYL